MLAHSSLILPVFGRCSDPKWSEQIMLCERIVQLDWHNDKGLPERLALLFLERPSLARSVTTLVLNTTHHDELIPNHKACMSSSHLSPPSTFAPGERQHQRHSKQTRSVCTRTSGSSETYRHCFWASCKSSRTHRNCCAAISH